MRGHCLNILGFLFGFFIALSLVNAQEPAVEDLRKEIDVLKMQRAEDQKKLEKLEKKLDQFSDIRKESALSTPPKSPETSPPVSPIDQALAELPEEEARVSKGTSEGLWSRPMGGGATLRLIDISLDGILAVGGSTENDLSLQTLQGGNHDPRKNGFTLQQVELGFSGAVDPYVRGEAYLIYFIEPLSGESQFELEEAFLVSQSIPWGFQVEAGYFFTEFGRQNPIHPHAWHWQDQPFILTRFFGGDGIRQVGARVGWLMPTPWFSEFHAGVQNANGETMVSFLANDEVFEERSIGGRPLVNQDVNGIEDMVWLMRWVNGFNFTQTLSSQFGMSGLIGPNATGPNARTYIAGGDWVFKWRPNKNFRGWPFVIFEGEFLYRIYEAQNFYAVNDPTDPTDDMFFPNDELHDYGLYSQILYGFIPKWAAGLRFEYANSNNRNFGLVKSLDPFRDKRFRVSPLINWYLSEFFRLRLQYNYDWAEHIAGNDAHSTWLGAEFSFGAHPSHAY